MTLGSMDIDYRRGIQTETLDGVATTRAWYVNGFVAWESGRVNGLREGIAREWHDNGVLVSETPFVKDVIHGTVRKWNRAGKLLGEYTLTHGRGVTRTWSDDGSVATEMERVSAGGVRGVVYDDLNKPHSVQLWNGKPVSKKKFSDHLAREELTAILSYDLNHDRLSDYVMKTTPLGLVALNKMLLWLSTVARGEEFHPLKLGSAQMDTEGMQTLFQALPVLGSAFSITDNAVDFLSSIDRGRRKQLAKLAGNYTEELSIKAEHR